MALVSVTAIAGAAAARQFNNPARTTMASNFKVNFINRNEIETALPRR
jgi:hypothetical protein